MDDIKAREIFFGRRTDKTIFSKRFVDITSGQTLRIASHVLAGSEGQHFALVKGEVILRTTAAGRFQIKATLLEDDRSIRVLTIQRYSQNRPLEQSFSFVGQEIDTLLEFVAGIRTVPLEHEGKLHVSDDALKDIVLNEKLRRGSFSRSTKPSSSRSRVTKRCNVISLRSAIAARNLRNLSSFSRTAPISPRSSADLTRRQKGSGKSSLN